MDLNKFSVRLDVVASGLLHAISPDLLDGQNTAEDKIIRAEMYKLNVYDRGSFFKAHKDTPRGEDMIGSLVVVFPTAHKGGELTLSHAGNTWTFDSAAQLTTHVSASTPAIAYIAFYSDVTHAVEPVLEGHRVTLTYNLFLVDRPARSAAAAAGHRIQPAPERLFADTLRALLAEPTFLPEGGLLAFGLAHQYPMPAMPERTKSRVTGYYRMKDPRTSKIATNLKLLKGTDARIRTVADHVGLETHLKLLYEIDGDDVLLDHVLYPEAGGGPNREDMESMIKWEGEIVDGDDGYMPVYWVTYIGNLNSVALGYVAHGNEASLEHIYGNAALFVTVPAIDDDIRCPAA